MFKELAPYLRQRAVLLTVTHVEEDQIRVNVIPQKLKEGENAALTTPLTVTASAEELDRDLPATLVSFVGAHLGLKNSLDRAKAEMDGASRWRLMQQMMIESLALSCLAAALGAGAAIASVRLLAHELAQTLPVPVPATPDMWVPDRLTLRDEVLDETENAGDADETGGSHS
jgi:PRTRC genetic system protein E